MLLLAHQLVDDEMPLLQFWVDYAGDGMALGVVGVVVMEGVEGGVRDGEEGLIEIGVGLFSIHVIGIE